MCILTDYIVDHPHGGGRGKSKGNRHPVTPWGKPVSLSNSLSDSTRRLTTFADQIRMENSSHTQPQQVGCDTQAEKPRYEAQQEVIEGLNNFLRDVRVEEWRRVKERRDRESCTKWTVLYHMNVIIYQQNVIIKFLDEGDFVWCNGPFLAQHLRSSTMHLDF